MLSLLLTFVVSMAFGASRLDNYCVKPGFILGWNKAAEEMFGYTKEEAEGNCVRSIAQIDKFSGQKLPF